MGPNGGTGEPPDSREESVAERADRNLTELQQELRVLTTAVQIMFAFLLTVPFSARLIGWCASVSGEPSELHSAGE